MRDIMCQCQREAYEKEEAERIRREFLNDIAVKRSAGLHDRALYECFAPVPCVNHIKHLLQCKFRTALHTKVVND